MSTEIQRHPELEDLAAFADGRLPRAERLEVQAHLADCPACYEVVSEVLHLAADLDEAPEAASKLPRPANENEPRRRTQAGQVRPAELPGVVPLRQNAWRWPAAALVAAALVAVLLWHPWSAPRPPAAALLAALPKTASLEAAPPDSAPGWRARLGDDWTSVLPQNRGAAPEATDLASFYRAGVRLVQLEVAIQAADPERAGDLAFQVASNLDRAGILGLPGEFESLGEGLAAIEERPETAAEEKISRDEWLARARQNAARLFDPADPSSPGSRYFLLGQWAEATRLAAELEATDYFTRRRPRLDLQRLLDANLPEPAHAELEAIQEELENTRDLQQIAAACRRLHDLAGRL